MGNRRGSVSRKGYEDSGKIFVNKIKEALFSALITAVAATLCTVAYGRMKHLYFDKPVLNIILHNKSFITETMVSDSGEEGFRRNIYEGVQIDKNEKTDNRYILITGDPSNPGFITVAVGIINNGNLHATITDCELDVIEYKSMDGFTYGAHIIEQPINPDKYVVLYGNVDPAYRESHTLHAKIDDNGSIVTTNLPLSARIQPKDYKIYYVKIKLLKRGIYRIQPRIHYFYRNKTDSAVPDQTIDIIYDRLDNKQLEEKRRLFKMSK